MRRTGRRTVLLTGLMVGFGVMFITSQAPPAHAEKSSSGPHYYSSYSVEKPSDDDRLGAHDILHGYWDWC